MSAGEAEDSETNKRVDNGPAGWSADPWRFVAVALVHYMRRDPRTHLAAGSASLTGRRHCLATSRGLFRGFWRRMNSATCLAEIDGQLLADSAAVCETFCLTREPRVVAWLPGRCLTGFIFFFVYCCCCSRRPPLDEGPNGLHSLSVRRMPCNARNLCVFAIALNPRKCVGHKSVARRIDRPPQSLSRPTTRAAADVATEVSVVRRRHSYRLSASLRSLTFFIIFFFRDDGVVKYDAESIDGESEEKAGEEEAIIDLATVLNAIIESSDPNAFEGFPGFENVQPQQSQSQAKNGSRKRSSANEDGVPRKRNGAHDGSVERQHPLGLVDSKAKNKVTCAACRIEVCNTARQRHVFLVHVKREDLYRCPECSYQNSNSIWETRRHCQVQHGPQVEPINNEEKYKHLIIPWNRRCFPDWKHKKPYSWAPASGDDDSLSGDAKEDLAASPDDVTSMIRDAILSNEDSANNNNGEVDSGCASRDEENETPVTVPTSSISLDDRTCQLCLEESRYPGRHIAQKHLDESLYDCPICKFGSYESCSVAKHIHKVHPDEAGVTPISNLERLSDVLRDLQQRCFPNRPMKLVRMNLLSRPRERHICKVCDAQVAQSDRQRHVYHRHLGKDRIFECPLCPYASNYDIHRIKWHLKWIHKDETGLEPISHENKYRDEIDKRNDECFPDWNHRVKRCDSPVSSVSSLEGREGDGTPSSSKVKKEASETSPAVGQRMNRVSEWTCRMCMKEFKPTSNFLRHVAKDHLDMPLFQCQFCDEGAADASEVKAHMVKVHDEADVEPLSNLELNPDYVQQRFQECFPSRKMKANLEKRIEANSASEDLKVTCQECFQEMKTEDRQIHVYRHHLKEPKLYECPLCDFSHHACSSDVRAHIKYSHREQADLAPRSNLFEYSQQIADWNLRCFPGWINRKLPASAIEDFTRCRLCDQDVRQTSRHIAEEHLKIQLHACPRCTYGAPESRLVKRHLRNAHNDLKSEPISNVGLRRADFSALHDKCFPGRPKRLSSIIISEEGRRTKCKKCAATISRKRRLQHTLERHVNRPSFQCPHCPFSHTYDEASILTHMRNEHDDSAGDAIRLIDEFMEEVRTTGVECFPDWQMEELD
ncbi:unnamed protein product [Caenorhabditis auriculariae]|uniref:C2H2-type domain-containing protein n=1 Tax=Caenorhabditis auriculariae TaxID=2777116 RepID=A0A8S1H463_9PELO|nr:unnamed protein product [Caenorhabditis auriculariae]